MEENNEFVARQSSFFNYLLGAIFLAIFIGVIFTIKGQESFSPVDYIYFVAGLFLPAVALFINGTRKNKVLQINKSGIYFNSTLITKWERFIWAYIIEDDPEDGFDIKFSLFVEYYQTDTNAPNMIKFQLSATLDKSVEEIESAIETFSKVNT